MRSWSPRRKLCFLYCGKHKVPRCWGILSTSKKDILTPSLKDPFLAGRMLGALEPFSLSFSITSGNRHFLLDKDLQKKKSLFHRVYF